MAIWSMRQTLTFLIGSTLATLALSASGYFAWRRVQRERLCHARHQISAIVQTGPEKEALKTAYLAELLELSQDAPLSLYALDLKKGEERLLSSPLIAHARLKRIPPSTLYIDYETRHAVASLADYENTALDPEGYLFPIAPFLSPKELPHIYLGLPPFGEGEDSLGRRGGHWQEPLQGRHIQLALEVLQFLDSSFRKEGIKIEKIDVSNAFASSLGQREIVLFIEEELSLNQEGRQIAYAFPKILRLNPKDYQQQLLHFLMLRRSMAEDYKRQMAGLPQSAHFAPRIIDLRIPQLAFIENHP